MTDVMSDYRRLVRLTTSQEVAEYVRGNFRGRVPGQYLAAVVDIASTGSYPVNREPGMDRATRLGLAWRLLGLGEAEQALRPEWVAARCLRLARELAEEPAAGGVPSEFTVDAAVRRGLRCLGLGRPRALEIARQRRRSYAAALPARPSGEQLARATAVPGDRDLLRITVLLDELAWFERRVGDPAAAAELRAWLAIRDDLGLGDEIAELLAERIRTTPPPSAAQGGS
ncbi:hypothetical protein [Streptomyces sp. NBC_01198]|uniref:hypothetical protein n=1 Tax=Streptomyces sp. NBC_01198 TaxID=2903769 RepID=UPI002E0E2B4C|nr:hypothetical protein OG702_28140 [Streptomyces sp. NBC_01198]